MKLPALPTVNQLLGTALTLAILFALIRLLPIPDSVKAWFRV